MGFTNQLLEASTNTPKSGGTSIWVLVIIYGAIFAGMYFLLIRPNKKKQKEEKLARENLQVGDEIVTIGGLYGRVISLKEDTFVIESISDHTKLTFSRAALQTNLTVHDDVPAKK